tara:strand:+ start:4242 stop:4925 length:684 start_codon:yes stop_codon:yes gene_type:complete
MPRNISTVLFDLDGTLCDTAPDLQQALNQVLALHRRPSISLQNVKTVASDGASGLIGKAFGLDNTSDQYEPIKQQLLDHYRDIKSIKTTLYEGMDRVLHYIEQRGLRWGIVTNKPTSLTEPLLKTLNLAQRAACVVCGDTLAVSKPDPKPIIHACELIGAKHKEACYVGDHHRDISAGNAAGLRTITALYGYIADMTAAKAWPSHAHIHHPSELIPWLGGDIDTQAP